MDVLVCPSCSRRYAVTGVGQGGWRCPNCSDELRVVEQDVRRVRLFGPHLGRYFDDGHLHLVTPGGPGPRRVAPQ